MSVSQHSTTGTGPNKKLAKRAAAESLLQLLGYSRSALTREIFIISSIQIYNVMFISASIQKLCLKLKVVLTVWCPRPSAQPSKSAIKTGPESDKMCDKGKKVSGDFHFLSFRNQMPGAGLILHLYLLILVVCFMRFQSFAENISHFSGGGGVFCLKLCFIKRYSGCRCLPVKLGQKP